MVLHSLAFGIYLFALALFTVVVLFDESGILWTADAIEDVCAWASNILLGFILLQMVLPSEEEEETEIDHRSERSSSDVVSVKPVDFDEDAQLQARIWNLFAKKRMGLVGSNVQDISFRNEEPVMFSSIITSRTL